MGRRKTKETSRESSIERSFLSDIKKHCPKIQNRKMHGVGDPDRLMLLPHNFAFFIEFKRRRLGLRDAQEIRRDQLSELGYTVLVVGDKRSADEVTLMIRSFYDSWVRSVQAEATA